MSKTKVEVTQPGAFMATAEGEQELKVGKVLEFDGDVPDFLAGKVRLVAETSGELTVAADPELVAKLEAENAELASKLAQAEAAAAAASEQVQKLVVENESLAEQVKKLTPKGR